MMVTVGGLFLNMHAMENDNVPHEWLTAPAVTGEAIKKFSRDELLLKVRKSSKPHNQYLITATLSHGKEGKYVVCRSINVTKNDDSYVALLKLTFLSPTIQNAKSIEALHIMTFRARIQWVGLDNDKAIYDLLDQKLESQQLPVNGLDLAIRQTVQ